ncbi:hypothetical protein DRQ25_12655 [Candidatus Fermentibacteria bacterium]|nr:MAG: hypothetical protein DRQ25_12655 [Candidatus Fermentibacteria bacterium]
MKAPKTRSHYRNLIKAGELITLIQDDVFNTDPDHKHMTPQRVNAIKLLLNKVLPDLKAVELSGDANNPIQTNIAIEFVNTAQIEFIGPPKPKVIESK